MGADLIVLFALALTMGAGPRASAQSPRPASFGPAYTHPGFEFESVGKSIERPPVDGPYLDLDRYYTDHPGDAPYDAGHWQMQCLPGGIVYKPYLAAPKESRLGAMFHHERDLNWQWDASLGGRVGLFRYGTTDVFRPAGFQIDIEASAQARLDLENNMDLSATDYRVGFPVTYGTASSQWKLAYYHMSSHLGDEFLIRNPGFTRVNWARDAIVLGYSHYFGETVRLYGEIGYAVASKVSRNWEVQFGVESAPMAGTGFRGAPFWAVNAHLREEVDYGGNLVVEFGWAWRGDQNAHLLRTGLYYLNGKSNQFSFFNMHEEQLGIGFWLDL